MSNQVCSGDEVGALVFDPGHYSFRAGFAGDEIPKFDIPSMMGITDKPANRSSNNATSFGMQTEVNGNNITAGGSGRMFGTNEHQNLVKHYAIDTVNLHVPKAGMEVGPFLKDGEVEDWDMFEKMIDYVYSKSLNSSPKNHPLLLSEPAWNPRIKREKLAELFFEKYQVPAFLLAKTAVLTLFANGRSTGMVVDSGATHTSAIPVHDGYVLSQGILTTPLGGDFITRQTKLHLEKQGIEIVPQYMIASKKQVRENEKAKYTTKTNLPEVTNSWSNYMVKNVLQDFQATVLHVSGQPYDEKRVQSMSPVSYEFPNGYNQDFAVERFRIPEPLFDPSGLQGIRTAMLGVGHLVTTSVGLCDADLRPALYGNVIVTGGNSLLTGYTNRLNRELSTKILPSMKLKLISMNGSERRFGAWIGGSIQASLGTFRQLWITKQEYEEKGKSLIERKCR